VNAGLTASPSAGGSRQAVAVQLLVLGGTRFLGRALVEDALARGHQVTLFNRALTNPELFPEAERVRGDRTDDLSALEGRTWDAVLDVATFLPRVVRLSVEALGGFASSGETGGRVGRYVYVSSISVYADQSTPPVEGAAVLELEDPADERIESYGALKAVCERIVTDAFGEAATIVRPGLIVGPHDPTGRFTYWPVRVAAGGEVLAPGSPDDPVQFVDVRDLAAWILDLTERGVDGVFNATGESMPFERLLDECRAVSGSDAQFTWVRSEQLLEAGVEEWMGVPLWIASPGWGAANRVVVAGAIERGLSFRPLAETIRDTLAWNAEREWPPAEGVGLSPARERELLDLA
jgi:nucleoside-diphosphate-sugar epimerase